MYPTTKLTAWRKVLAKVSIKVTVELTHTGDNQQYCAENLCEALAMEVLRVMLDWDINATHCYTAKASM